MAPNLPGPIYLICNVNKEYCISHEKCPLFLLGGALPLYVTFSVRLCICRAPYLRNRTSSDHDFCYTDVE